MTLINNSISTEERMTLSGIGRHVWRYSLQEDCGALGDEFREYFHSPLWQDHKAEHQGRHYVLEASGRVSALILPLIAKCIVLNNRETVYYAVLPQLVNKLRHDDIPPSSIVMIDGINDMREQAGELPYEDRSNVEDFLWECMHRGRRIYTAGHKPLTGSLWWTNRLMNELDLRTTTIQVKDYAGSTNRR